VSVRTADGQVSVCVQDDGVGTDPARARGGLVNLQDRARDLGGTFELLPSPDGGTLIDWRVPLTG
jgi:signal transduction histidine kinase